MKLFIFVMCMLFSFAASADRTFKIPMKDLHKYLSKTFEKLTRDSNLSVSSENVSIDNTISDDLGSAVYDNSVLWVITGTFLSEPDDKDRSYEVDFVVYDHESHFRGYASAYLYCSWEYLSKQKQNNTSAGIGGATMCTLHKSRTQMLFGNKTNLRIEDFLE